MSRGPGFFIQAASKERHRVADGMASQWRLSIEKVVEGEENKPTDCLYSVSGEAAGKRHGLTASSKKSAFDEQVKARLSRYPRRTGSFGTVKDLTAEGEQAPALVLKSYHPRAWMQGSVNSNQLQWAVAFIRAQGFSAYAGERSHEQGVKPFLVMQRVGDQDLAAYESEGKIKALFADLSDQEIASIWVRLCVQIHQYHLYTKRPYGNLKFENLVPAFGDDKRLTDLILVDVDGALARTIPYTEGLYLQDADRGMLKRYNRGQSLDLDSTMDYRSLAEIFAHVMALAQQPESCGFFSKKPAFLLGSKSDWDNPYYWYDYGSVNPEADTLLTRFHRLLAESKQAVPLCFEGLDATLQALFQTENTAFETRLKAEKAALPLAELAVPEATIVEAKFEPRGAALGVKQAAGDGYFPLEGSDDEENDPSNRSCCAWLCGR